jgi:hypothetical protein
MWNKNWEREWEDEFMLQHDWANYPDTQQTKQEHCDQEGYKLKGCIAKNIGRVKDKIIKAFQRKGKMGSGKVIKRWRNKIEAYDEGNKYRSANLSP